MRLTELVDEINDYITCHGDLRVGCTIIPDSSDLGVINITPATVGFHTIANKVGIVEVQFCPVNNEEDSSTPLNRLISARMRIRDLEDRVDRLRNSEDLAVLREENRNLRELIRKKREVSELKLEIEKLETDLHLRES